MLDLLHWGCVSTQMATIVVTVHVVLRPRLHIQDRAALERDDIFLAMDRLPIPPGTPQEFLKTSAGCSPTISNPEDPAYLLSGSWIDYSCGDLSGDMPVRHGCYIAWYLCDDSTFLAGHFAISAAVIVTRLPGAP